MSDELIREKFENAAKKSTTIKYPLGAMEINGAFHHYMDPDTDNAWIGFRTGYLIGRREQTNTLS